MTKSQTAKQGKAAEEKIETASPNQDEMLSRILYEIKNNMDVSSTILDELDRKIEIQAK